MRRTLAVLGGLAGGALAALALRRRSRTERGATPPADAPAEELRRKLAQARETAAEEDELEPTGTGPGTMVEERVTREEVEAVRQRVHEEGRAAAEEMRRAAEGEEAR